MHEHVFRINHFYSAASLECIDVENCENDEENYKESVVWLLASQPRSSDGKLSKEGQARAALVLRQFTFTTDFSGSFVTAT